MWAKYLVKLLNAVELLSRPQGATIAELQKTLKLSRRTVYRLKESLENTGFPLVESQGALETQKRWKLEKGYLQKLPNIKLPRLDLTLAELIALQLVSPAAALFRGSGIETRVDAAMRKIAALLPDAGKQLGRLGGLMIYPEVHAKDHAGAKMQEIIGTLINAMLSRRRYQVRYHSFSSESEREFRIDPLCFFRKEGGLYVIGQLPESDDLRVLAVERIISLKDDRENFEFPQDFQPEKLFESAFGFVWDDPVEVEIWISADQARYIKERRWASEQTITDQADGSIILWMRTSGWWEVKRWILSMGPHAELLEPAALRQQLRAEIRALSDRYR